MAAGHDFLIQEIDELVQKRITSDRRMGYIWMIVPILPVIVAVFVLSSFISVIMTLLAFATTSRQPPTSAVAQLVGLYVVAIFSLYIVLLVGAAAIYYLIDRRNAHFTRQHRLFMALAKYVSSSASEKAGEHSARLSKLAEDQRFDEPHKPAAVWAILYVFITPIVGLVVGYGLTSDIRKHDEIQLAYEQVLTNALGEAGITVPPAAPHRARKREPLLYVILTLVTGGLFWVYWFYTMLKDYNGHFQEQAIFEDNMLVAVKPAGPVKFCHACGTAVPEIARFCPACGKEQAK